MAEAGQRCGHCLLGHQNLRAVTAAVDYAFPWSRWALALKTEQHLPLATIMAEFMAAAWRWSHPDVLPTHWIWTGVPLHPQKWRQRGFNQAWQLAHACQHIMGDVGHQAARDLLIRHRWQHDQHTLPHQQRAAAVKDAFAVSPEWVTRLQRPRTGVVIVDDVMTTGATLNACASAILQHGTVHVEALVFARTPPKSG